MDADLSNFIVLPNEFNEQRILHSSISSKTILALKRDSQTLYAMKSVLSFENENNNIFIDICNKLVQLNHPCSMPISYLSLSDQNQGLYPAIYSVYTSNQSLQDIIEKQMSTGTIEGMDSTQEAIILYGISKYLSYLHGKNQIHGRLKASNVLLDPNLYPLVSDPFFYELNINMFNSTISKSIDYIVSLSNETLLNGVITSKSDIYSFGILMLQIFSHQINVFSNLTNNADEIENYILNKVKPTIPSHVQNEIRDLLERCLSDDPDQRPNAEDLVIVLKRNLYNEQNYDKSRFESFQEYLNSKNENLDPEIAELKRLADEEKDPNMMYAYGRARCYGEKCQKNISVGLHYIKLAKKKGHAGAAELYNILREKSEPDNQIIISSSPTIDSFEEILDQDQHPVEKLVSLMDDDYFEQKKTDIQKIINNVNINYDKPRTVHFEEKLISLLKERNFVFTEEAQKRLTTLYNYLEVGIPVLLEGPTGTAKTLSSEIVCDLSKRKLIRFNLSSETKSADLLGRYVGDADSWAGISHLKGPFITAFESGYTLLLDEINLASPECLQFIEGTLDSGVISVELPGMPLREIHMHENFRLIATQNPNKGLFAHKRQDLGTKFLSRFQIINFPAFTQNELIGIARGLANGFGFNCSSKLIEDLVEFHMEWSKRVIDDVQCFTVREIAATIRALADKENIYETIMTIYGARYPKSRREELRQLFTSFSSFKNLVQDKPFYPKEFSNCFRNPNLFFALKSVLFSFKNKRHVIISAAEGVGVTQFARWVAQYYDKINSQEQRQEKKNQEFFCVCSEETKCSDLIGRQKPSDKMDSSNELIKWKSGFLTKAIKKGKIAILDSIDEAPATVTERLNGLLDQKYDGKIKYFEVPENPKKREVEINQNFRLLCTCKIDKISQMSPAFINRFDVIVLENQLENIKPDELKELVTLLLKSTTFTSKSQTSKEKRNEPVDFEVKIDDDDDFNDGWGDEITDESEEINQLSESEAQPESPLVEEEFIEQFAPTDEQVNLVYNRVDTTMSMSQIAQFCHAVAKYIKYFEVNDGTFKAELIIEFAKDMLNKNEDFAFRGKYDSLGTFLLSHLQTPEANDDNEFFYERSPLLCEFIAKLYAASLINLPVCVYGPTGAGKTSAARAFARIRPCSSKGKFQMHSFHSGTKPNNFYGTTTIKDRKIHFINGTLTIALSQGDTFIADEMNLSSPSTMKSLAAALEPCAGEAIYIPGVGEEVIINNEFFFIACQNEVGTIGRNAIPSSIVSRFRYFDYPKQEITDISSICYDISQSFYKKKKGEEPSFIKEEAMKVGEYMIELNNLQQRIIPKWSLRDVTKIFQRIHFQDCNPNRFLNIKIYHNILFYTMSPVNQDDCDEILPIVIDLIGNTFGLNGPERNDLHKCFNDPPKVIKEGHGKYIMKGKCGIKYEKISNSAIEFKLTSLLNSIFSTSLSDETEPILLMGPSGFKTFLSEYFLPGAKVITLNQESTIAQLLGSSAFLTDSEAKIFYLEQICNICHIESKYSEFSESLKKGQLKKENIINCINFNRLPMSFKDSADSLIKKLFDENTSTENKSAISNITLEFRPGLFLSAILQGKSLILKNLSNLPTIVLERFNELFSGKHNLTLNEDIHNTFTNETSKELTNFSSFFRVFATCPPNSATKLSEAVLSRFTVICVPSYQTEEQEMVINSYISKKQLSFESSLIPLITKFSKAMANHLSKTFSFTQMINVVEMCGYLNRNIENNTDHLTNLSIILYRLAFGLLEKRKHNQAKLLTIFDELELPLPEQIKSPKEENPLVVIRQNGNKGVKSTITKYFIDSANALEKDKNPSHIFFNGMFSEMLDVLHLGLAANIPVIFEGMPGQGKQTAIDYIAKILGYKVINIIISQATKVDDLLGKVTITRDEENNIHVDIIKTKLVKAFESSSDSETIIVFHNINNASPAVLEVLVTIFDRQIKNVLLTNGSPILKGHLNLVGIFNPQNGMFHRDRLPSSLVFSSLYHIVNDPKHNDVFNIVQELFLYTGFKNEAISFYEKYTKTKKIADENNATPLTLNDIVKYILFRKQTFEKFDESTISQMIFAYRYLEQEITSKVLDQIDLSDMKSIPCFTYNIEGQEIYIRISEDSKTGITLPLQSNDINTESIQSAITCLTLPQKNCLLFLACAVLSKRSCIIQGSTASGKSHIIRLFAKMLGQKLNVYQMNRDTDVSILTGQSVLSNTLTMNDIKAFRTAFADLKNIPDFDEFINNTFPLNENEWKPSMFSSLLKAISEYQQLNSQITDLNKKYLNSAETLIRQTILPANRFHPQESSFIRAMLNGEWVLIDGIESAPPEIAEKISSLCGDNPELDLLECGEGFYFTKKDIPNSHRIHDNFHLFVTYNPSTSVETKMIDPSFINKCVSFTLPEMDSTPEYTGQIILGLLLQSSYPVDFAIDIGARIGNMHNAAKNESIADRDSFAGDVTLTGRTVKFISKEFKHFAQKMSKDENADFINTVHQPICYSMEEYYWNSYTDKSKINTYKNMILKQFTEKPSDKLIQSLHCQGSSPKDRNGKLLIDLRNIQKYACQTIKTSEFSFASFVNKCLLVSITDAPYIYDHIQDTIKIIDQSDIPNKYFTDIYESQYSQLKIMERIFKEIIEGMSSLKGEEANLTLNDPDLLKEEDLEKPLSKLLLLSKLVSDNCAYISPVIPSIIFNSEICMLLKIIISMMQEFKLSLFDTFVSKMNDNQRIIPLIESIFPYNYFIDTPFDMISYWLPLFRDLNESKTTFHVIILDHTYDFIYSKKSEYEPTYIFKENDELLLSPGTNFKFSNPKIPPYSIPEKIDHSKLASRSSLFYGLTQYLLKNPNDITKSAFSNQFTKLKSCAPNPREYQLARYSLLFHNKAPKPSMIAKAWSIVYTFPNDLIDVLLCYLHPLEIETTQAIMNFYQLIDKQKIDPLFRFSQWMLKFGKEQSILWRLKNFSFSLSQDMTSKDAEKLIQQIDSEIKDLNEVPELNLKIWSKERYISDLENAKNSINEIIQNLIKNDQDSQYRHLLGKLIAKLQKEKIINKQYDRLRQMMITQISKVSEQSLTQDKVNLYENRVNNFLTSIKKEEPNYIDNSIMWPLYTPSKPLGNVSSKSMKLYQHIIWFSIVHSICSKIIDPANTNIFESITELSEYIELQSLVLMLVSRITNSESDTISPFLPDDVDIIFSTINAVFISKLYKDNLINHLNELDQILNDLEKRNELKDERDFEWIHKVASQYPSDFDIVLPQFKPKDLFFLFVGFTGYNETPNPGPILGNIKCPNIVEDIKRQIIAFNTVSNFKSCSDKIGEQIYRIMINPKNDKKNDKKNDIKNDIKNELDKCCSSKYGDQKKILEITLHIMDIAEKMDKMNEFEFTFNDTLFLNGDWIKNTKFADQYPSFVYWLCKNQRCTIQLQNIYGEKELKPDRLPFWLFAVRLMSSENCITFDCKIETDLAKKISQTVEKSIKNSLRIRLKNNKSIGFDWLNIILSSVSPEISKPNYRLFYQFLISLSEDYKQTTQFIENKKTNAIQTFAENICNMLFDNTADKFLDLTFDTASNDLGFVKNPSEYINSIIHLNISNIYKNFLQSKELTQLINFSTQKQTNILKLIDDFSILCDKEENNKRTENENNKVQKRQKELERMENDLQNAINEYNNLIQIINSEEKMDYKDIHYSCRKLINLRQKLPNDIEDLKTQAGCFYEFTCSDFPPNTCLKVPTVNDSMYIKKLFEKEPVYLKYTKFDENSIKKAYFRRDKEDVQVKDPHFQFYEMHSISDAFNIPKYCSDNLKDESNYDAPVLIFGSNMNKVQFLQKLRYMSISIDNYISTIKKEFENETVSENIFKDSKMFVIELRNFNSTLTIVNFSNKDPCISLSHPLRDILNIFQQYQTLISNVNNYLTKNIENSWKMFNNQNRHSYSIFNYDYKLPIPVRDDTQVSKNLFKAVNKSEFLSSPILNTDNDKIACCFSTLDCSIDPIIPELYSKPVAMNFISFIEEPVNISIETEPQYSNWFIPGRYANKNDIIQIFINFPAVESDEKKECKVSTLIHFSSPSFKELVLPCEFSFTLLPLSIFISCLEYPLTYNDSDKTFILCTDKILSKSKLSFIMKHFNLNDKPLFSYQLSSLENNKCEKPVINNVKDECIELTIPNTENAERINFALKVAFSDHFKTSIIIDAIVIPFDFNFDAYDYKIKTYNNKITIYYSKETLDRPIILNCRLYSPSFINGFSAEIRDNLPSSVIIKKYENISREFNIEGDKNFNIILEINKVIDHNENSNNPNKYNAAYSIGVKINGIEKKILLEFNEVKNNLIESTGYFNISYLNLFPVQIYDHTQKNWKKVINEYDKPSKYPCIISPFNSISTDRVTINYNFTNDCPCQVSTSNSNIFISISNLGYFTQDFNFKCNIKVISKYYRFSLFGEDERFIPVIGIYENYWYPTFNLYPLDLLNWTELDIENDSNVEIANKRIKKLPEITINTRASDFILFADILSRAKVVKNISSWIKYFPKELQDLLHNIILRIATLKEKDNKMNIISHNLILFFCANFYKKYEEIKKNEFNIIQSSLSKTDIRKKMDEIYKEITDIDPHAESYAKTSSVYNKFKKIKNEIKNIQVSPKLDNQSEAYLFIENSIPISKKLNDKPQYVSATKHGKSSTSSMNKVDIKLPKILIPSNSDVNTLTLSSLNNIYLQCLQCTRLLPIYVFNMWQQDDLMMENEANKCFMQLLKVYKDLPVTDHSFVSSAANLFISSFNIMIGKFKKAGVNLQSILPSKCNITDVAVQDFIQYPEKDKPFLRQEIWDMHQNDTFSNLQNMPNAPSPSILDQDVPHHDSSDDDFNIPDDNPDPNNPGELIFDDNPEQADIIDYINIMDEYRSKNIKKDEDEPEDGFKKPSDQDLDQKNPTPVVIIKSQNEEQKIKTVNTRQFDGMVNQFTEKDGIERAIRRMQEMDKNGNLKISNARPHELQKEFLKPDKESYPIISLMTQGYYLTQEFIKAASNQEIPYSSIAVNILIDCSSFISDENKAFNMLIICGLTQALNALEIPYSAAVIADENFKCVIKPFNEPHSIQALQRICDCLMIKRYRTKLASSMKFAIDSMSYNLDTSRPNRAIFTLTDGLDEQLILTKAWAESILTNDKISFGFVFIKSTELTSENLQFLENAWRNFETEVISNNARSVAKIVSINAIYGKAVADKLSTMFANVMKRSPNPDLSIKNIQFVKPKFETTYPLSKAPLERFYHYLESDLENIKCGVYVEMTQILKDVNTIHEKPDSAFYRNMIGKISESKLDASVSKGEYESFLKKFIENRRKLNQAALETIFKPNKASQTVLSTTGTDFDITALILNLINPVPDPLIYLEEKGGLVRNYGITVVIDSSISCFHNLSGPHTLQTIRNVLSSISSLDLPCFDLIIAGNKEPIVLCSEVGTNRATNIKSSLWQSLLSILQTPLPSVDLASAIKTALDLRLMRSTEYSNIILVLTDGLFEEEERIRIINAVNNCVQSGMNTFGIGVGIYPKGIEKIFSQIIYSPNPSNTMKGIASIYGDSLSNQLTEWPSISLPRPDDNPSIISDTNDAMRLIIKNASTPSYQSLKQELHDITPSLDAFDDLYNEEQDIGNSKDGYKNPVGRNTELYVKDSLKTQKILIVMLWDCTMNPNESKFVHPDYISKSSQPGKTECIKTAVDHYGIKLKVVQNYNDAIDQLTNQDHQQGYCDYYAVWVFCGPPYPILPDENADANLVGDFIEVLIKFWKNGGSIVFMAEGGEKEQLTYQANLFLEMVTFDQEKSCPSGKTKLRLIGEHAGEQILLPDESENLDKIQTFNRSAQIFKQCERTKLSHNIGKIFEGITISYAPYDLGLIKPFRPFARDSEGGISSLFYPANLRTGTGDIIIDCGFTKCFTEMTTDGTFRYIQNIAGWTARPEVHLAMDKGIQPCDWRPKAVIHTTQKGRKWNKFKEMPKPSFVQTVNPIDLPRNLWCIDCSGSVGGKSLYHNQLSRIITKFHKSNDEYYLWDDSIHPSSYSGVQSFISRKEGHGGTSSYLIADICQKSSIRDHLIIVTDGQVGTTSIDTSDKKMKSNGIKFKFVSTYVIGSGGNLSVGAPYSRGCPNVTYKILSLGDEIPQTSLTAQDMETLNGISKISSYSQFISQYNNLESAIQAKTLGTSGDSQLSRQLDALSSRITRSGLNSSQRQNFNNKINILSVMANGALRNTFTLDDIGAALKKAGK